MRVLSGIQPSGKLHFGNWFGAMRQHIEMQAENECFYFIANLHALTTVRDPRILSENTLDVALDYLALGLDAERTVFFKQSDVPEVTELTWILSTITPMGLLERCHSYKDKMAKGLEASHGLFAYPVLMAADILIYKSELVPVGRDQKQHIEVTRDIAQKLNNRYGEVLTVPEALIVEEVAVVPGIDGQKMSKSYDNTIELFAPPGRLKKRVMSIVTDSRGLDDPKDPENCNVFSLYKLFADAEQATRMAERYRTEKGFGYGHAKKELLALMEEFIAPARRRREELAGDLAYVEEVLRKGAERARETASVTLREVKEAVGIP